ncbi:hypothetical protein EV702DRAFT_135592 [Suillus placidus]|uniref:Uncharacterized protein n=1 Tax=Suillus placidus TaxID=48579 RepID=A0A9P7D3D1_9AGAM|nr:hypothetical protein EV702DRAFT_135592 [Suillus placidus]
MAGLVICTICPNQTIQHRPSIRGLVSRRYRHICRYYIGNIFFILEYKVIIVVAFGVIPNLDFAGSFHLNNFNFKLVGLTWNKTQLRGSVKAKNSRISAIRPVFSMSHVTQVNLFLTGYRKYSPRKVKWSLSGSGRYPEKQPTIRSYHPSIIFQQDRG